MNSEELLRMTQAAELHANEYYADATEETKKKHRDWFLASLAADWMLKEVIKYIKKYSNKFDSPTEMAIFELAVLLEIGNEDYLEDALSSDWKSWFEQDKESMR